MIDRVTSTNPSDTHKICVQDMQNGEGIDFPKDSVLFTAWEGGKIQAIYGFIKEGNGRNMAVSLLAKDCGRNLLYIVRKMAKCIEVFAEARTEMLVRTDFKQAHRMAILLGFTRECTMRKFRDGIDYDLYSFIKEN